MRCDAPTGRGGIPTYGGTFRRTACSAAEINRSTRPGRAIGSSAIKLELAIVPAEDAQTAAVREKIKATYLKLFSNPDTLPELQQMIANAPKPLPDVIPNPKRVLDRKQELTDKVQRTRSRLQ